MAYTVTNFKTKKALKEAVASYNNSHGTSNPVRCKQYFAIVGLGPDLSNYTGTVALEGPHYPKPHSWYAQAELKDGIVVKVS